MTKHAVVLRPSQIRHLLRVTEAMSRHPERDALILLLGITCGMRVTEIARIEVADVDRHLKVAPTAAVKR
jgi:integrase